ncbi:MAG: alanine--glyoxylate aminotransferase family protein [Cytophagales bacterium]|nr:MAG: alanine--glyoxylate aminotransferase family protein [Cytophagales bacterium]
MPNTHYFTPGPAALYPTYAQHLQEALHLQIGSISHRSRFFSEIYEQTYRALQQLLGFDDEVAVLFVGSATEVWERSIQNGVDSRSAHLVNGAFSEKFYQFAKLLQKDAIAHTVAEGKGFVAEEVLQTFQEAHKIKPIDFLAFTHNETATGVSTPSETIERIADAFPDAIRVVDMVSSAPYPHIDFRKVESAFFSVQKAFGMPAGLGVWLVNHKFLKKSEALAQKGAITGTYHRLSELWKHFEQFQTPATPPVLPIYLLGKIAEDLNQIGIEQVRKLTDQKAQLLYEAIGKSKSLEIAVAEPAHRSATVVVANTQKEASALIEQIKNDLNMEIGAGYGKAKNTQIRIANFPAVDFSATQQLADYLAQC